MNDWSPQCSSVNITKGNSDTPPPITQHRNKQRRTPLPFRTEHSDTCPCTFPVTATCSVCPAAEAAALLRHIPAQLRSSCWFPEPQELTPGLIAHAASESDTPNVSALAGRSDSRNKPGDTTINKPHKNECSNIMRDGRKDLASVTIMTEAVTACVPVGSHVAACGFPSCATGGASEGTVWQWPRPLRFPGDLPTHSIVLGTEWAAAHTHGMELMTSVDRAKHSAVAASFYGSSRSIKQVDEKNTNYLLLFVVLGSIRSPEIDAVFG
ncbi:hypothetical protein TREES_T100018497 [Tupaia chinensis]|uniref:Uncharacterized protein n=1 Tax=Tupaia chinensis TaxID=246437 RepID=L9KY76_TUPCH|nr:hypothetical protein TREES_T100018497 [Tupaia chinensis]